MLQNVINSIKRCHGNLESLTDLFFRLGKQKDGETNPYSQVIFEALKSSFEEKLQKVESKESLKKTYRYYAKTPGCSILSNLFNSETSEKEETVAKKMESTVTKAPLVPFDTKYVEIVAVAIA